MRWGMRNPCELKIRFYADCLIDTNDNLAELPGVKASDKIGQM